MTQILTMRRGIIALLILFSSAIASPGQSRDRDNPTPLSSAELRGELDGSDAEYFYSFEAGPGDLTLTFDVKATGTNSGATFDLFDKNSRPILSSVLVQAINQGSDRSVQTVQLFGRQAILMRIKGIDYGGSGNRGVYIVRLNGAVKFGQAPANSPPGNDRPASITAPSTDRDAPTPLDSNELRGELDGSNTEYFYSFVAGPGELTVTFDVKAAGTNAGATLDLFDKNSRPILSNILAQGINRGSDRLVKSAQLGARQTILIRIKGIDYGGGAGRGTYLVRLGGPVTQGGSSARPPSTGSGNRSEPSSEPLSKESNRPANKPPSRPESSGNAAKAGRVEEVTEQKRVALIIGNSSYADNPLLNPVNDARDMAQALRELGFEVMAGENLNKREMEEKIRAFGKRIAGAAVGLFYFSGHGLQVNGYNYLLPIGARIEKEQDVEYEAVEAGRVLGEMDAARNRLNIVILDACRNNPFARSFRSVTRGLAMMSAPSGTLVAYSTSPGSIASDGEGKNGLYTQELLNGIRTPGLKLEDVFKRVRIGVKEKSMGKQIPWETSALDGDFYFVKR
jgi:hypothetical protein